MEQEPKGRPERAEAVDDALAEVHRRVVRDVARRDRHLDDGQAEVDGLEDDLGVEHEAVRVAQERHRLEETPAVGAVAGVALREAAAHREVLERRQEAVGDPFPERHPARARASRRHHARAEHHVGAAFADRPDHLRNHLWIVLAVGVQHHNDRGPVAQRLHVAGLLVAAVAHVVRVADRFQLELPRALDGVVAAVVVHHDDLVAVARGDRAEGLLERARRVVGGHHDHDLLRPGSGERNRRGGLRPWHDPPDSTRSPRVC